MEGRVAQARLISVLRVFSHGIQCFTVRSILITLLVMVDQSEATCISSSSVWLCLVTLHVDYLACFSKQGYRPLWKGLLPISILSNEVIRNSIRFTYYVNL
jgi:hypothetical protein